jgi:hypothetical protein
MNAAAEECFGQALRHAVSLQTGNSVVNRRLTEMPLARSICGGADTAGEDSILPQRNHSKRRFLAIGFLDIDARAADVFM